MTTMQVPTRTACLLILVFGCYTLNGFVNAFVPQTGLTRNIRSSATKIYETKKTVFIDGEAGTTGIQVRDRLGKREDIEILSIPDDLRKDVATRKEYINKADAVILCTFHCCYVC